MVKNYFFKALILGGIVSSAIISKAQHDPYFTHFRWNQQSYNPAAAGYKVNYICINGLSHFQYRQYADYTPVKGTEADPLAEISKNQAPVTYNLNLNTLLSFGPKGRRKMGVGVTFLDDKIGFMKTTTVKGALNYRIPIQDDFGYLALGIDAGLTTFGYDNPKFIYIDPNDPHIPASSGNASELDFGFGFYYSQKKFMNIFDNFYVGGAYNHLNAAKYDFSLTMADGSTGNVDVDFVRYLYLTTGADWNLANPNWKLEPSVLVKYNPKLQIDLSMTALFSNTFRGGLAYRTLADAVSVLVGYERGQLQVGYSYDITLNKIRQVSDGTHEVFLKYCIPITFPPPPEKTFRVSPRFLGRGAGSK